MPANDSLTAIYKVERDSKRPAIGSFLDSASSKAWLVEKLFSQQIADANETYVCLSMRSTR